MIVGCYQNTLGGGFRTARKRKNIGHIGHCRSHRQYEVPQNVLVEEVQVYVYGSEC